MLLQKWTLIGLPLTVLSVECMLGLNQGLVAETFSELQKAMDWLNGFGSKAAAHKIG